MKLLILILLILSSSVDARVLEAKKISAKITIDGIANDPSWSMASWQPLDQLILGTAPSAEDFSGRFKVMWDSRQLYLLVEIVDDVLYDSHPNPLESYWNDDCLEIFIDEDNSGGDHQFNFNAFAYHVALDNQVVDIGKLDPDGTARILLLNNHLTSRWKRSSKAPFKIIWEVAVRVYDDSFVPQLLGEPEVGKGGGSQPVLLTSGKKLGFMLAYCDNDHSPERESFIGSTPIKAINGSKNLGYITSDVFSQLLLTR